MTWNYFLSRQFHRPFWKCVERVSYTSLKDIRTLISIVEEKWTWKLFTSGFSPSREKRVHTTEDRNNSLYVLDQKLGLFCTRIEIKSVLSVYRRMNPIEHWTVHVNAWIWHMENPKIVFFLLVFKNLSKWKYLYVLSRMQVQFYCNLILPILEFVVLSNIV